MGEVELGPNLISNPSVETSGSSGLSQGWFKGGYGTNTRALTYLTSGGHDSIRALKAEITAYTSGDAKWYFQDVAVIAGKKYQYSDWSISNVEAALTVRYKLSDGSFRYFDLGRTPSK